MQTLTTVIQKLPEGGYVMTYAIDGQVPDAKQAQLAKSTLIEIFDRVHLLANDSMKESALRPPTPPAAQIPQLSQYQSPQPPHGYPNIDMPKVVDDMRPNEPEPGLVDKIRRAGVGGLRGNGPGALVWFVILTVGYMAQRMA